MDSMVNVRPARARRTLGAQDTRTAPAAGLAWPGNGAGHVWIRVRGTPPAPRRRVVEWGIPRSRPVRGSSGAGPGRAYEPTALAGSRAGPLRYAVFPPHTTPAGVVRRRQTRVGAAPPAAPRTRQAPHRPGATGSCVGEGVSRSNAKRSRSPAVLDRRRDKPGEVHFGAVGT